MFELITPQLVLIIYIIGAYVMGLLSGLALYYDLFDRDNHADLVAVSLIITLWPLALVLVMAFMWVYVGAKIGKIIAAIQERYRRPRHYGTMAK